MYCMYCVGGDRVGQCTVWVVTGWDSVLCVCTVWNTESSSDFDLSGIFDTAMLSMILVGGMHVCLFMCVCLRVHVYL